jgi:hypothetical protein
MGAWRKAVRIRTSKHEAGDWLRFTSQLIYFVFLTSNKYQVILGEWQSQFGYSGNQKNSSFDLE